MTCQNTSPTCTNTATVQVNLGSTVLGDYCDTHYPGIVSSHLPGTSQQDPIHIWLT